MSVQDSPEEMVTAEYWPSIDSLLKPEFKDLLKHFEFGGNVLHLPTLDPDYKAAIWVVERASRFGERMILSACIARERELRAEDRVWFRGRVPEDKYVAARLSSEPDELADEIASYLEPTATNLPMSLFSMRKVYFRMSRELPVSDVR